MIPENKRKVLELFKEGRSHYKMRRFKEARESFSRALKLDPNDGPSKEYVRRCTEYLTDAPPEDWDGVYVMKTK